MLDPRITGSEDEARQITLALVLVLLSVVFYGFIIVFYGFNMVLYGFVWFGGKAVYGGVALGQKPREMID